MHTHDMPQSILLTATPIRVGEAITSALLVCLVFTALGSPLIYRGWQTRDTYQELLTLQSTGTDDTQGGEIVQVSGRVKSTEKETLSPLRSERCELAFWKVATLRRYDVFNYKSYWSVEGLGIDGGTLVVAGEHGDVRIRGVGRERTLSVSEKVGQLFDTNENTVLDSVLTELDPPEFEDRWLPSAEWPPEYVELGDRIDIRARNTSPPGILGRILNAIRTPQGTRQFQETTVSAGETVTVIGTVVGDRDDCVRLRGTGPIDPVITRASMSEWVAKHRRAYWVQLYGIPLCILALSSLAGVGVFL